MGGATQSRQSRIREQLSSRSARLRAWAVLTPQVAHIRVRRYGDGGGCDLAPGAPCALPLLWTLLQGALCAFPLLYSPFALLRYTAELDSVQRGKRLAA